MAKILISHPISRSTIQKLGMAKLDYSQEVDSELLGISEELFYANNTGEEILYVPNIALKQIPDEAHDSSLEILGCALKNFQPDVLIVGNNAVPGVAIEAWRQAVGENKNLLVIRRGVDTRAIAKTAAQKCNVVVENLPGINSPYVAKHMMKYLELNPAKLGSKIAVIGVGNIGKVVAKKAINLGLEVSLFSPSLCDENLRLSTLLSRGISPEKVICFDSTAAALKDANYVAVAIPWLKKIGGTNAGAIAASNIANLAPNAKIASASVPGIFSEDALALLNELVKQDKIYVRIDTPKRHAVAVKQKYPYIDAAHDEAFAAPECQQELDNGMLKKAREFISISQAFPKVRD